MTRPIAERVAAQLAKCARLEAASVAEWIRLQPEVDALDGRLRLVGEDAEQLLRDLDAWEVRYLAPARAARERLWRLQSIQRCDLAEAVEAAIAALPGSSSSSGGVPGVQREEGGAASSPLSPAPSSASSPAALPSGNPAPTTEGRTGTPKSAPWTSHEAPLPRDRQSDRPGEGSARLHPDRCLCAVLADVA